MNHEKEQADVLAPLRALPPEVDLDQVAHMVAVFPLTPEPTSWLSTLSNNLNILIMSASTLLLGLGLYLFGGNSQQAHTPPPTTPAEVIVERIDSTPAASPAAIMPNAPSATLTQVPPVPVAPAQVVEPPQPLVVPEPLPYDAVPGPVMVPDDWQPAPMPIGVFAANERSYPVKNFRAVEVLGNLNITLETGDFAVTAQGEEEVLARLNVKVDGDRLVLYVQDRAETKTKKGLFGGTVTKTVSGSYGGEKLNITVHMPALERAQVQGSGSIRVGDFKLAKALELRVQGSGSIKAKAALSTSDLTVSVQGSGRVECAQVSVAGHAKISVQGSGQAECRQVGSSGQTTISVQGSGRAQVSGATEELVVSLKGSGNVQAQELSAQKGTVDLAGSGNVYVKDAKNLTVQSAGSGKVRSGN